MWFLKTTDVSVAAVLGTGNVLTWGYAFHGGDSSSVQDQLQDVTHLQVTRIDEGTSKDPYEQTGI